MSPKPKFDPSQPYEAVSAAKPKFDPSQPFEPAQAAPAAAPRPEPTLMDHIKSVAQSTLDAGNRASVNWLQAATGNAGHAIFPRAFAAADYLGDTLNGIPSNYEDNLHEQQREWARNVDPTAVAIGSVPLSMALGQVAPAANTLGGLASLNFLQAAGNVDQSGGDLLSPQGAGRAAGTAALMTAIPYAVGGAAKGLGWMGGKIADAASGAGESLKDLAGRLKVNSLHPTPVLAETMAELPGGTAAVGRELLDRGIGGLTKAQTAKQVSAAMSQAGSAIDDVVRAHDSVGGSHVDIDAALGVARSKAQKLLDEPTTEAVGQRLMDLIEKYAAKFNTGKATATDALGMKRALGKLAYGQNEILKRTGDTIAGEFGEGVSTFERAVDDSMDKSLGPDFEAANLVFRRLKGASNAAERSAARAAGNHVVSLKDMVAAHAGLPIAAGHMIGSRYGAQAGARSLYTLASMLESSPQLLRTLSEDAAPASQSLVRSGGTYLQDLLDPYPRSLPAYALKDNQ
jgi:hypothetical protein